MLRPLMAISVLALAPALGFSQTEEESWDNLKQLKVGQKIQVVDMKLKSHSGTFLGFSEEAISLRLGKDEVAIQRPDVMRVSLRENSKRLRNMLIGLAIGVGAGLAIGAAIDGAATEEDEHLGKTIFTPIGAGAGAGIGAAFPGYQTIYRAKRP